jgi:hypothetical protein
MADRHAPRIFKAFSIHMYINAGNSPVRSVRVLESLSRMAFAVLTGKEGRQPEDSSLYLYSLQKKGKSDIVAQNS